MHNLDYNQKIEALIEHYRFSTKLAEALGVHRMSIQNWRDGSVQITKDNKLNIDMQYAMHCILPTLHKSEVDASVRTLEKEEHNDYIESIDIVTEVSRFSAFGSLEVEISDVDEKLFYKVVDGSTIEKEIEKRKFLEMNNLAFVSKQVLVDTQEGKITELDSQTIKKWHYGLMNGIRDDAGAYSTKMRMIPDTKVTLTAPEDIAEEVEYWVGKYATVKSIYDIAHAHEHFELIHPFGDGNGRVGRIIMGHQFLMLGLLPPLIDASNKALYYVALEKAQVEGNIIPLVYFLIQAVERMKEKLGMNKRVIR